MILIELRRMVALHRSTIKNSIALKIEKKRKMRMMIKANEHHQTSDGFFSSKKNFAHAFVMITVVLLESIYLFFFSLNLSHLLCAKNNDSTEFTVFFMKKSKKKNQ